jgi:DNA-binding response OmpR family regulator
MAPATKTAPKKVLRVLVVDDNLDQVHTLAYLINSCGHHVDYAINATVGLDLAHRLKPEVILLDLALPDASGIKIGRKIRRIAGLENVYLIAVTGTGISREEVLAAGFDEFIRKPVQFSAIEALLAAKT